jgi:choloylglycine hydrolase
MVARILAAVSVVLLSVQIGLACTGVTLEAKDGTVISARSLEFGLELDPAILFVPRGFKLTADLGEDKQGATWTSRYACLGMNVFGQPLFAEGLNEAGLGCGAFYLPGYAEFAAPSAANAERSILSVHVVSWILGNCATVAETKQRIQEIDVVSGKLTQIPVEMPLHYRVTDATGAAIVIEYTKGGTLKVHDAPFGIITNSPTYDWHMTNLSNYTSLQAADVPTLEIQGQSIREAGIGSGLLGIPGDYSPASRFVRATVLQAFSTQPADAKAAVNLALHLLNNVDIPVGPASEQIKGQTHYDRTEWVSISDLTHRAFYFRTYDNQQLRRVALDSFDFEAKNVTTIPLGPAPWYQEVNGPRTAAK